jgi:hypothetical protein
MLGRGKLVFVISCKSTVLLPQTNTDDVSETAVSLTLPKYFNKILQKCVHGLFQNVYSFPKNKTVSADYMYKTQ